LPRERFESLAYFTSIGPTPDGRIKPDIVAPGTTISAHQCVRSAYHRCLLPSKTVISRCRF
jgi:Subtilase family